MLALTGSTASASASVSAGVFADEPVVGDELLSVLGQADPARAARGVLAAVADCDAVLPDPGAEDAKVKRRAKRQCEKAERKGRGIERAADKQLEAAQKQAAEQQKAAQKQAAEQRAAEERKRLEAEQKAAEQRAAEERKRLEAEQKAAEQRDRERAEVGKRAAEKRDPENRAPEKRAPEKRDPENRAPEKRDPENRAPEKRADGEQTQAERAEQLRTAQPAPLPISSFDQTGSPSPVSRPVPRPSTRRRSLRWMAAFTVVRIRGMVTDRGAYITLLRVKAPRGSAVSVRCAGGECPARRASARATRLVTFKRFHRHLRAGTRLEILVTKRGYIGKYTRFVIHARRAPKRVDLCLGARNQKPVSCLRAMRSAAARR